MHILKFQASQIQLKQVILRVYVSVRSLISYLPSYLVGFELGCTGGRGAWYAICICRKRDEQNKRVRRGRRREVGGRRRWNGAIFTKVEQTHFLCVASRDRLSDQIRRQRVQKT